MSDIFRSMLSVFIIYMMCLAVRCVLGTHITGYSNFLLQFPVVSILY
ncbi:hypothetical protein CBM2626_A190009 [Cupriavidus taiwanensis]|nr:hypothetical protein CBM2626_A190009 [Cupriavidus taiwanensis]